MGLVVRLLWFLALGVLAIGGCKEVAIEHRFLLSVTSWDGPDAAALPLEGAKLCEADTTNCVLSDANGDATLALPIGPDEIILTLEKEGHGRYLLPYVMGPRGSAQTGQWQHGFSLPTNPALVDVYEAMMSSYPMRGTGSIELSVEPRREGVTFELVDATSKTYYIDEEKNWRTDLTATTDIGWGGFVEVTPGVFEVEFGGTSGDCARRAFAWPGSTANSMRLPVREGYTTFGDLVCAGPP